MLSFFVHRYYYIFYNARELPQWLPRVLCLCIIRCGTKRYFKTQIIVYPKTFLQNLDPRQFHFSLLTTSNSTLEFCARSRFVLKRFCRLIREVHVESLFTRNPLTTEFIVRTKSSWMCALCHFILFCLFLSSLRKC